MEKLTIKELSEKEFNKQINADTTEFECFFHYTDELLFEAGFKKGYEFAIKVLKTNQKK